MTNAAPDWRSSRGRDADDAIPLGALGGWVGFVLRSVRRHPVVAATAFLSVVGLTVLALKVLPFRYQVQASLLAQRNPLMTAISNPGLNRDWDLPIRAAREVVLRRDNLAALCKQTNLVARYLEKRPPLARARHWVSERVTGRQRSPEEVEEGLIDTLEDRLVVWTNPGEGTVTISFDWTDPVIAFDMVTAAVQSFLEARYASEINSLGETIAILEGHDARVRREIEEATRELEAKERGSRARVVPRRPSPGPAAAPVDDGLARLEAQAAARRRVLTDLEEVRARRISELQALLAQQLTVYAPQHPLVISTRQNLEGLAQVSPQIEALRAEVRDLESQVVRRGGRPAGPVADPLMGIQSDLADVRLQLAAEDTRLEYDRSQLRLLLHQHQNLLERIDAARVEMDTARAAFKGRYVVTSPPQMPKQPYKPNPMVVLVGGLVGAIAFAFFAATVVDLRSGWIVEPFQVEEQLEIEVIGDLRR